MKKLIFLVPLLIAGTVQAQPTFQKFIGGLANDWAEAAIETSDSGYVVAGHTLSFTTGIQDMYVVKLNKQGDTLWTRNYATGGIHPIWSIVEAPNTDLITVGREVVTRIDANGNLIWVRFISGIPIDEVKSIKNTLDGNFIITGFGGVTNDDIYLIKLDQTGQVLWSRSYGTIYDDEAGDVIQTQDSGYAILGRTYGIGAGNFDMYLIKTDSLGNQQWAKSYGGSNGEEWGEQIHQLANGSYVLFGTYSSLGSYLVKVDNLGNLIWSRLYLDGDNWGYSFAVINGGFIATGVNTSMIEILKLDDFGNVVYKKAIAGTPANGYRGAAIFQTSDNYYFVAGTVLNVGNGAHDMFVMKMDTTMTIPGFCNEYDSYTDTAAHTTLVDSGGTSNSITVTTIPTTLIVYSPPSMVDTTCNLTGVGSDEPNLDVMDWEVYPNPTSGEFQLTAGNGQEAKVYIYDIFGRLIEQLTINNGQLTIDITQHPKGIYLIKVIQGEEIFIQKLAHQ